MNELHHSIGQLDFYALLLEKQEPNRILYLAMPKDTYKELTQEPLIREFIKRHHIKLILYNTKEPTIEAWIS